MTFKDCFSANADQYAASRPSYPIELVDLLARLAPARGIAWDCGCGSGQMSVPLAERFDHVIATDASAEQVARAKPHPRVTYRAAPAERSGIDDHAIDCTVAAQAAHWFDLPAFYNEVRRVSRSGAILALVTYDLPEVSDSIDRLVRDFYRSLPWPPERRMVEEGYASIPFAFDELAAPRFFMRNDWTADQMIGYVHTWSALKDRDGRPFASALRETWLDETRPVRWPISMRVGRIA